MIFANSLKGNYPYETAPIKRLIPIRHFGLEPDYMGGIYPYAAELKNGLVLLVNKNLITVGVGLDEENLEHIEMSVLKEFAKAMPIEFDWRKTTKEELIEKLKE